MNLINSAITNHPLLDCLYPCMEAKAIVTKATEPDSQNNSKQPTLQTLQYKSNYKSDDAALLLLHYKWSKMLCICVVLCCVVLCCVVLCCVVTSMPWQVLQDLGQVDQLD